MARGEASPEQQALAEASLMLVKGPIMMPLPAGTALVGEMLCLAPDAPERERITSTFHRFLPVNRQLRDLCTAWQCRPDGSVNDHSDIGYDAEIRDRLDDGDNAWFASPLIDSYHTVWMHVHQELLLTIGMSRADDEALEERLVAGSHG
jgi:hypothetical protein